MFMISNDPHGTVISVELNLIVFSFQEYNLDQYLEELEDITIDLSFINIYSSDVERELNDLRNSDIDNIQFDTYFDEVWKYKFLS